MNEKTILKYSEIFKRGTGGNMGTYRKIHQQNHFRLLMLVIDLDCHHRNSRTGSTANIIQRCFYGAMILRLGAGIGMQIWERGRWELRQVDRMLRMMDQQIVLEQFFQVITVSQ